MSDAASVKLCHHGAAASSHRGVLAWIPPISKPVNNSSNEQDKASASETTTNAASGTLVYASHSVLNLTQPDQVVLSNSDSREPVWHVRQTLCTSTVGKDNGPDHVITCLASVAEHSSLFTAALVTGFADGTVTLWARTRNHDSSWIEIVLNTEEAASNLPITCITAIWTEALSTLLIMVGTSLGASLYQCKLIKSPPLKEDANEFEIASCHCTKVLKDMAVCSLNFRCEAGQILALIGTAAPRHNKIHVLHTSLIETTKDSESFLHFHYSGSLTGHEDWITCLAWTPSDPSSSAATPASSLLASGSQDARIRLWKFTTFINNEKSFMEQEEQEPELVPNEEDEELLSDDDNDMALQEEEEEEGESRLDIYHHKGDQSLVTRVSLEALLLGHEEGVTSVCWYQQSQSVYHQEHLLISSSMDRSILLWTPATCDGIWTPLTRVGSAGGILGGSVGSTLLGYLAATMEPQNGRCLIGHAYGGALHVWNLEHPEEEPEQDLDNPEITTEELASSLYWKASPCVTGHFAGVTDLCWEASSGNYLLTVSEDQTCRLWGSTAFGVDALSRRGWLELGRPQVHGYNLAAVTSLSSPEHPHFIVSGADEKELRAFEAPQKTLRVLQAVTGIPMPSEDPVQRVERAYIPSLGLSNKATAAEGAEEDTPTTTTNDPVSTNPSIRLPLERDLGAESLWPEVQKLFGHHTELYCVTSTLEAQSAGAFPREASPAPHILVASTCKARDADAAAIRLWRAREGTCHQILSGGHKSTVATLAFSSDGKLLASSGKDRRLCFWQQHDDGQYQQAWAKESAHKRIVWSVHFLPYPFNVNNPNEKVKHILASGSRDGCVKIWSIVPNDEEATEVNLLHSFAPSHEINGKPDSVTALSFCPRPVTKKDNSVALLALGLESGRIELWNVPVDPSLDATPQLNTLFAPNICHKATVTKLAWRPVPKEETVENQTGLTLASCSMDHGCRLFDIQF